MYEVPEHLIIEQVEAHMRQLGISPHGNISLIADGELHRYTVEGDSTSTKNGAYRIHTDGVPAWYLCDWKRNIDVTGKFDDSGLTGSDKEAYTQRINDKAYLEQSRIRRETLERKEIQKKYEATQKAKELYEQASPATPEHDYLIRKRIANIQGFRLGANGELLIPLHNAFKPKEFLSLQQIYPGGKKYFVKDTSTGKACYEFEPEEENDRLIIICEGIATGETFYRLTGKRFRVVCAMNCNNLLEVTKGIKTRFPRADILIGADNDLRTYANYGNNPGRSSADFVVRCGHAKGIIIPDFLAHQDGSDWNDYEAINGADKTQAEISRQLEAVLSEKGIIQENNEEEKEKSQSEDERLCAIRDAFLKDKHIFFHGSIEHGEYFQYQPAGFWTRMTNAELRADLSAYLGHKNSKDIGKIATMIRDMCCKREIPEWNKGRLDNFPNGTLELDTGKFREHRPEDYLTFEHIYNYNPAANDCSVCDAFMKAVTKGEQSRIEHLIDILAYTLYEDNALEKIFFLIGSGANGKGTFLHLIEDLFTNANPCEDFRSVTHVQPCDFDRPTERIALEGSILNVAYDVEKDLRGCSSYLKSLAGNDRITGNHKFCDSHSFTSRAKVISSCNHIPIIDDDSFGMRRKLCFIRFEAKFDEGTADTHMREKLQAELPAIYNRVYAAYLELRKREELCGQDAIRLSCDQPELIKEFTVFADPIKDFWLTVKEEYLSRREIPKPAVFDEFKKFAERNNIDLIREGIREKTFQTKFYAVLNEDSGISANYSQRKNKEGRYYCYTIQQSQEASLNASEEESNAPEIIETAAAPVPEESTQPEDTQTPPEEDSHSVIEADSHEPPALPELLPMSEEDAQTLRRLLSGEKIECD